MTPHQGKNGRAIWAWCMYDFANSSFTTLVVTFIYATYFTQKIAENEIVGTTLWSRSVTCTAIIVALLSPVVGAIADRGGYRKFFLLITTVVGVVGTAMLYTALPGQTLTALGWFVMANIAFETSEVFYNAFLPELAPPDKIGRVSGYGWGVGYVGGLLAMFVALIGFVNPEHPWFGFSKVNGENIRATNLLVAVWFAVFSLPLFLWVKEKRSPTAGQRENLIASSFRQLTGTFREIRRYRQVLRFLLARLFFNDALITIFAFGGIYAAGTFHFSFTEIMIFGIVLNITAGLGAFVMGFLDDVLGGKRTILLSLWGLALASLLAICAGQKAALWIAGAIIGIFSGPNQSASRSLLGRFIPPDQENEFYGFFAFSGKATAFLGPFFLGLLTDIFHTQRAGLSIVILLFIIGGILLHTVDEEEGKRAAGRIQEKKP